MFPLALLLVGTADPATPAWPGYGGPTRDFRVAVAPAGPWTEKAVLWRRPLGPGESGIVSDGTTLFTQYSVPDPKDKKRGEEVVVALDPATGKTKWEHKYPAAMLPKQETYRGAPVGPQATPLVGGGRVFAVGFAGLFHCLDAATGKVLWKHDLVAEYDATPVQFGFAASPVAYKDVVLLHVGGKQAAVMAFDPKDGAVRWKSAPAEPAYATPVVAAFGGEDQVVQVTRDTLYGFAAADGSSRWTYPLPKPGLTNVPTPIPLPGDRLLVSGQGFQGTRLLEITKIDGRFAAKPVWHRKEVEFFYCNWAVVGDVAYGYSANAGSKFVALRWRDGEVLWEDGRQKDANLLAAGDGLLLLRGDGKLARARPTADDLGAGAEFQLLAGRCWTPPTLIGGRLYARNAAEVVAFRLAGE
ncbi:MAG: PQQ-like beta-propeller repeat protein [Gemmataceae bacterium]|nr:PQQ-like beta-propeller repeat protein [Gemmataceae bacterium]